jgi:hypothetical protein
MNPPEPVKRMRAFFDIFFIPSMQFIFGLNSACL